MFSRRLHAFQFVFSASLLTASITRANSAHADTAAPLPEGSAASPAAAAPTPSGPAAAAPPSEPAAPVPDAAAAPAAAAPVEAAPPATPLEEPAKPAATKPKPPPYSLPWQLRPVAPANVIRLDTAFAFYDDAVSGKNGAAQATSLLGSYKVIPDLAVIARVGLVHNSPPDPAVPPAKEATSILNPVLGALYGLKLSPQFKLGLFLGVTIPVGSGGGDNPNKDKATANGTGAMARSMMDNAMFATNYFTVFPGVDVAFVHGGLTVQAEATLFQLMKTRGPDTLDDSNTNFTTGLHAGYFVLPVLSLGAEIRHQHWLSTPAQVKKDDTFRAQTSFAVGPRFHFKLSEKVWFRPGIALSLPIDDPMNRRDFKIAQLDLPISF